jgi:hypothetical protein
MTSITGIVSPATLNTSLTAKQPRIADPKVAVSKPNESHNKPLPHLPGKVQERGPHKADGFTARPPDSAGRATQARQLHQIAEGVRSGKLSSKEAESLLKGQQDIFGASSRAMADGKLTAREGIELTARQANAQKVIDAALKGGERSLSSALGLDKGARTQATQLDKLATGIATGTITRAETGHLLGQQVSIADARGDADTTPEKSDVSNQLAKAGQELERHGKAGTQLDKVVKLDKVHAAVGHFVKA